MIILKIIGLIILTLIAFALFDLFIAISLMRDDSLEDDIESYKDN